MVIRNVFRLTDAFHLIVIGVKLSGDVGTIEKAAERVTGAGAEIVKPLSR
jgi:hypothetical protein